MRPDSAVRADIKAAQMLDLLDSMSAMKGDTLLCRM